MSERYERPEWVQRVNAMGLACGGATAMVPIETDELLESAQRTTGIDRMGDLGDGDWLGRLRALVDGINATPHTVVGRIITREEILRCLRTRLLMSRAYETDPSIDEEVIDRPLVITGPARSGTTILFELLALDTAFRSPIAADVMNPLVDASLSREQHLLMTSCEQEFWADVQPEFASMHELRSDLPVECITIGAPSFAGNHWTMVLAEQGEWVPDPGIDMLFHRQLLKLVQHGKAPKRWILKTPSYLMTLDQLFATYPDAQVIQTHRDPSKTMPSTASTSAMIQWLRTDAVPLDELSMLVGAFFSAALLDVMSRRQAGEFDGVFGDVRFHELMRDPVAAIGAAYAQLGETMTEEHAAAVVEYLRNKPRGKHGLHRYEPEDWGFNRDVVRDELAAYIESAGVELE